MAKKDEVMSWAEAQGLRTWTHGKNVIRGNVNIQCLWCDDNSNHLNINPEKEHFFCWRCPKKGGLLDLIMAVQGVSKGEALEIKKRLFTFQGIEKEEIQHPDAISMPSYFDKRPSVIHAKYLKRRGFDWRELRNQYDIRFAGNRGDFKFRIIVPVYMNNVLVSYIGRDVTGKTPIRYKVLRDEKAVIPRRNLLYNIDSVAKGGTAVFVEGITDVWKLGAGAIALLSASFTKEQVLFLRKKEIARAYVLFDAGAEDKAEKFANALYWADVSLVTLQGYDDPGELPMEEAAHFMRSVLQ